MSDCRGLVMPPAPSKKYHRRKKWNVNPLRSLVRDKKLEATTMRGVLLWLLGVPISVIILLYLFHVI